jgi:hypothetical protein
MKGFNPLLNLIKGWCLFQELPKLTLKDITMKKIALLLLMMIGFFGAVSAQTTPTDSSATQILGKYTFGEGSPVAEVTVVLENGVLMMNSTAGSSTLEKTGTDVYTITQFQGTATFKRGDNNKVVGVTILAMGYELVGTKVPSAAINGLVARKVGLPNRFAK